MDFDFSDDQRQLQESLRRFLTRECTSRTVRQIFEGDRSYDAELWTGLAKLGFTGTAIAEEYGGAGLGYLELCLVMEELGRALAPVPFITSICLFAEAVKLAGSAEQKLRYLPSIADGTCIGTFAAAQEKNAARVRGERLTGVTTAVADGLAADFAVVSAYDGDELALYIAGLHDAGATRTRLEAIDPSSKFARIVFKDVPVEPLGPRGAGETLRRQLYDRAAVLIAFAQIGGAFRALEMARDYALDRYAFGRAIGSFQAIKHMLADMYVSAALARGNANFAVWALDSASSELPVAAAAARLAATSAFQLCAKNNIQVHGGIGFTWEMDCHLFYRRSNTLALTVGSGSTWEARLVERLISSEEVRA
ncbi:MAG: acyl-CoA dehydrogenase family protein [Rhizomicrobium sp.]